MTQSKHVVTFGTGENGIAVEKLLRLAAQKEGKEFPTWCREVLINRAREVVELEVNDAGPEPRDSDDEGDEEVITKLAGGSRRK